jgi:hypothetical protein
MFVASSDSISVDVPYNGRGTRASKCLAPRCFANIGRFIQKEIPVANGRIRILIDGDNDRLNMPIAPAFSLRETACLFERLRKGDGFVSSSNHLNSGGLRAEHFGSAAARSHRFFRACR